MTATLPCHACRRPLAGDGLCPACLLELVAAERGLATAKVDSASRDGGECNPPRPLLNIPGHEVTAELARGGMGIVYRARQLAPPREVALKMLLPHQLHSEAMRERFRLEARAVAALDHPAILPVFTVGEHDGLPYFTMKLATGGSLAERRTEFSGQWRHVAELVATLADAVQFAHERGVLHRDLKPGNVLFDDAGRAYVSDFGLAKLADVDTDLTRSADFLGTPRYVAPEIAAGSARDATTSSDVYALGVMLYELLAGRAPFEADTPLELMRKIAEEEPAGFTSADFRSTNQAEGGRVNRKSKTVNAPPRDLEVICLKCLAKSPARRYSSARELADDLRRWLDGRTILARPATRAQRFASWARRNPAVAALASGLLLVVVAGAVLQAAAFRRVRHALDQANAHLEASLLSQARAQRSATGPGRRFATLDTVREAAAFRATPELRDEAAAALALRDLRPGLKWRFHSERVSHRIAVTPDLAGYYKAVPRGGFALHAAGTTNELRHFLGRRQNTAFDFAASPDGRHVAAIYTVGVAEVWATNGAQPLLTVTGDGSNPPLIAFPPDADRALIYTRDEGVFLADLPTCAREPVAAAGDGVAALRFSPGGERFALLRPRGAEIWRVAPLERLLEIPLTAPGAWLAWSADGTRLAARDTGEVALFDTTRGTPVLRLAGHRLAPARWEFHPCGEWLASVGADHVLRCWDTRAGELLFQMAASPRLLVFSPDGRRLAAMPRDNEAVIYEWADDRVFREFRATSFRRQPVSGIDISADGRLLMTASTTGVRLWDTRTGEEAAFLPHADNNFTTVFFGPEPGKILYCGAGGRAVQRALSWRESPAGGPLVVTIGPEELLGLPEKTVPTFIKDNGRLWLLRSESQDDDLWRREADGRMTRVFNQHRRVKADFSPDGRWYSAGTFAGEEAGVWDTASGARGATLAGHLAHLVRFSPDGRWLLTCGNTEHRVWETGSWRLVTTLPAESSGLRGGHLAFTRDSRLLAVRRGEDDVQLWAVPEFRPLVHLRAPHALGQTAFCFSPDGAQLWLLGEGHRVFEWNLAALRQELASLGLDWE